MRILLVEDEAALAAQVRVSLADAVNAEKMFRMLMGDDVEGRREYILKNRITNLEEIDYGA